MAMAMLISDKKRRMQHDDNMLATTTTATCVAAVAVAGNKWQENGASDALVNTLPHAAVASLTARQNTPSIMM